MKALARAGLVAAGLAVAAGQARAQPVTPPAHTADGVVHPSANVDPGIKVVPKPKVRLPTPVIHPPVAKGDTVVVPK